MKKIFSLMLVLTLLVSVSSVGLAHWLEDDYDFGGEVVTIADWWVGGVFNEGRGAAHLAAIEEKYNAVIQFVWPAATQCIRSKHCHLRYGRCAICYF